MAKHSKHLYEFGPFRLDPEERLLFRGTETIPLPPKAFETLLILVDRSERVVSKDDLMKSLWPDTFVEEANLSQNIFVLRKALGDSAQNPRYIATVPGRGYRFAEKLREVVEEEGDPVVQAPSIPAVAPAKRPRTGQRYLWVWVAIVLIGCGLGYRGYLRRTHATAALRPSGLPPRRSIAVLGFRNLSGGPEKDWLSTALAEMLTTELVAGEQLRLVSGEDIARTKLELPLVDADSLSQDTLARLHKNLGSDLVVLGSYTVLGKKSEGSVRLDVRLQDTAAGETIADVAVIGTEANLFDLVSQAGSRLRTKLGVQAVSPADAVSVRAALPDTPEAARRYAEGLAKLRVFDALAARELLQDAVTLDPKFPLSHAALADAWVALGYDAKAKAEATKAVELSGKLGREERLAVEGHSRLATHDYAKAVEVYRTLFTLFPDNVDYGLNLAEAQKHAGKPVDAVGTLEALQKLPAPSGDDPRIDLQLAASVARSDHARALAADEQAINKGMASGAKLLVARARGNKCVNFLYIGKFEDAIPSCEEAQRLYASAGDLNGVGKELNDIGYARIQQGNVAESKRLWQEAAKNFHAIGNDEGVAATLANLATTIYVSGELAEAKRLFREALPRYRQVEDLDGESLLLVNLAELIAFQGELRASETTYQEAMTAAQRIDDKRCIGFAQAGLGDTLLAEGKLAEARKAYEQSLAIRNEIGEKQSASESRTYLAELAIEEGHAVDAEKVARNTTKEFHDEQEEDDELTAAAVLIEALLAQGKMDQAKAVVDSEAAAAARNQNRQVSLKFAIVAARAGAASGRVADAKSSLETILKDEIQKGFLGYQLETRLALAEIEVKSGHLQTGRAHLASLAAEAKAKDYNLLARKTARVRDN